MYGSAPIAREYAPDCLDDDDDNRICTGWTAAPVTAANGRPWPLTSRTISITTMSTTNSDRPGLACAWASTTTTTTTTTTQCTLCHAIRVAWVLFGVSRMAGCCRKPIPVYVGTRHRHCCRRQTFRSWPLTPLSLLLPRDPPQQ